MRYWHRLYKENLLVEKSRTAVQIPCVAIERCARSGKDRFETVYGVSNRLQWSMIGKKQFIQEALKNPVKCQCFHRFLRHGILFDLLAPWLPSSSGVIARSASSARLGWSQGVSLCRSVSWIVRLEESSELRGELFDVVFVGSGRGWRWVVWCCFCCSYFALDFGRSDLALEA